MDNNGIPYFPLTCQLNQKINYILKEFGLKGYAVMILLYQRIYGIEGYYCNWLKETQELFSEETCGISKSSGFVSEVIKEAIKRGIFSKELFDKYSILTSSDIQKNYVQAIGKRRTKVKMRKSYLLLKVAQIPKNVDIIEDNGELTSILDCLKEKEKKKDSSLLFSKDSFEYKASEYLKNRILSRIPKARVPKDEKELQSWAKHIDYMKRIDGLTETEIRSLIQFAVKDSFWQANILSTSKLREKKDTLFSHMQMSIKQEKTLPSPTGYKQGLSEEELERRRALIGGAKNADGNTT